MADVKSRKDIQSISDPLKRNIDPWEDFRLVERLNLEFTQTYTHSLGKYSRFFIELENQRFMATHCPKCQRVYAPARPLCPECLAVTGWTELLGTGTLETFSLLHFSPGSNPDVEALITPYVLPGLQGVHGFAPAGAHLRRDLGPAPGARGRLRAVLEQLALVLLDVEQHALAAA